MVAMANPQKEDGYTAIANELMEAIIAAPLGGGQVRLLLHLLRRSYGYNRKTASLSASEFAEATGLNAKVVSRELRDLEARGVIIVFREEGKTSSYTIQKDYTRWQTGYQKVPGYNPEPESTLHQTVPGPGTKTFPDPEPESTRSIYKEPKDNSKDKKDNTEPHGSAASGTIRQRFEFDYRAAKNGKERVAVIGRYFGQMLGPPNYPRIGQMLKDAKSGGALFSAMLEASKQTLTDDPHDYVAAIIKNGGVRATHTGRAGRGQSDENIAVGWRGHLERTKW